MTSEMERVVAAAWRIVRTGLGRSDVTMDNPNPGFQAVPKAAIDELESALRALRDSLRG